MELKKVFEAFYGGYSGPSSYYFIFKDEDNYVAKYGYSESGALLFEDSPELKTIIKSNNEYQELLSTIISKVNKWESRYDNNSILDGTQWEINIIERNKEYYGSNNFPSDFFEVLSIINTFFGVNK